MLIFRFSQLTVPQVVYLLFSEIYLPVKNSQWRASYNPNSFFNVERGVVLPDFNSLRLCSNLLSSSMVIIVSGSNICFLMKVTSSLRDFNSSYTIFIVTASVIIQSNSTIYLKFMEGHGAWLKILRILSFRS